MLARLVLYILLVTLASHGYNMKGTSRHRQNRLNTGKSFATRLRAADISIPIEVIWRNASEGSTSALPQSDRPSVYKVYGYPPKNHLVEQLLQTVDPSNGVLEDPLGSYLAVEAFRPRASRKSAEANLVGPKRQFKTERTRSAAVVGNLAEKLQRIASLPSVDVMSERMHIVATIARKRAMSKKLTFLTVVPPEWTESFTNGDMKAWRGTINGEEGAMELQLILDGDDNSDGLYSGATLASILGRPGAQEIMKSLKVGQKIYFVGVPKANPVNADVLDIVVHRVRVLEEVELAVPAVQRLSNVPEIIDESLDEVTKPLSFPIPSETTIVDYPSFKIDVDDTNVIYVDDIASLLKMKITLFPQDDANAENAIEQHINPVDLICLDCEWRPENYFNRNIVDDNNDSIQNEDEGAESLSLIDKLTNANYSNKRKTKLPKQKDSYAAPVSVLQIATRTHVFVIDLLRVCRQFETPGYGRQLLGSELTEAEIIFDCIMTKLFGSSDIVKAGLGITQDLKRLAWSYSYLPSLQCINAVIDVQMLAKAAFAQVPKRDLEGLSKLTIRQLGLCVDKSLQCSDWGSRPLSRAQIEYAAIDALVLTRIIDSLCYYTELAVRDTSSIVGSLCKKYKISYPEINHDLGIENREPLLLDTGHFISLRSVSMKETSMGKDWNCKASWN